MSVSPAGYHIVYKIVGSKDEETTYQAERLITYIDNGLRFSWRVEGLSPNTSYAVRVRAVYMTDPQKVYSITSTITTPQYGMWERKGQ